MKKITPTVFILLAVLAFSLTRPTLAEPIPDPPQSSDNAAVWYLTAQSLLASNTDKDLESLIENWQNPDLDKAAEVLAGIEYEMGFIRRGAALEDCAWAVDIRRDGVSALLPHLGYFRQYARLLIVSAEVKLESGDAEGAIDDLLVISRMSRHAAADGTAVGCLVQLSLDNLAAEALAKHLHRFNREELNLLRDQRNGLPPRITLRSSLATERLLGVWLKDLLTDQASKDTQPLISDWIPQLKEALNHKSPDERLLIFNQWLEEMDVFYQRMYDNFDLPYDAFVKADAKLNEDIQNTDNLFVKLLIPALGGAYKTERRSESIHAILDAAIALRLEGEQAFNAVMDPFDGKPFDREVTDAGLVVSSRLLDWNDERVSLMFSKELAEPLKK